MLGTFRICYINSSISQEKNICYVIASSLGEAISLLPEDYSVQDITYCFPVHYHPFSPSGSAPL